jgi:hypothetical protein
MYSLSQIHLSYCLLTYAEIVKFHNPSLALMNLHNGSDKINNNRTAKAISAIPIAGILVAAALLLGLLSVIGGETAIAQQNMTGTNATAANATAANATAANATAANATAANATAANETKLLQATRLVLQLPRVVTILQGQQAAEEEQQQAD